MNLIESMQSKYLPGFYQSRYTERKRLALSLKDKCQQHPHQLTLYELKIVLKVLQQFGLLTREPLLEQKEHEIKTLILQNSVWSGICSLLARHGQL